MQSDKRRTGTLRARLPISHRYRRFAREKGVVNLPLQLDRSIDRRRAVGVIVTQPCAPGNP